MEVKSSCPLFVLREYLYKSGNLEGGGRVGLEPHKAIKVLPIKLPSHRLGANAPNPLLPYTEILLNKDNYKLYPIKQSAFYPKSCLLL